MAKAQMHRIGGYN